MKVLFKLLDFESNEERYTEVTNTKALDALKKDEKDLLVKSQKKDQKASNATFQAPEKTIFLKNYRARRAQKQERL